jgi:3-deoxy-D-manno-octulosonate 8-phosphate phosphatase (KDO 8-P phosphatase)
MEWFEQLDENIKEKLKAIKILLLDVDGILTDGRIIMDSDGRETKNFDVKDGHGLKVLMAKGVDVVLITGRTSGVVEHRAKDLGIKEVRQGIWNKAEIFEEILAKRGLRPEEAVYAGDDIVDVPLMRRAGISITVADASDHVKAVADYVTHHRGGRGGVREICEMILIGKGYWHDIAVKYELK